MSIEFFYLSIISDWIHSISKSFGISIDIDFLCMKKRDESKNPLEIYFLQGHLTVVI